MRVDRGGTLTRAAGSRGAESRREQTANATFSKSVFFLEKMGTRVSFFFTELKEFPLPRPLFG